MAYATISKPSLHYNTKLYTGNGSTQSITGLGFQPDLNWIKCRDVSENHNISDSVRGDSGANSGYYYITPNANDMQGSGSGNTYVSSLDADGFSIGNNDVVNTNAQPFISWNWKANGAGSANTDGSINSTVSANTTAGFSIVKWNAGSSGSAYTVGHGLGAVPKMIFVKKLDVSAGDWVVYHEAMGNAGGMEMPSTGGYNAVSGWFNTTSPTSSVFSIGTNGNVNTTNANYIAYCFTDIKGYSKALSWTANNNNNGAFVYTGFTPAWFLFKTSNDTRNWHIVDNKRDGYNVITKFLRANTANAEANNNPNGVCDFLSNGIKFRTDSSDFAGTSNFIGLAFASEPLVANVGESIPATAK